MGELGLVLESQHLGSKEGRPEVQGHPQLQGELETGVGIVDSTRPYFQKKKSMKPKPQIFCYTHHTHRHTHRV